MRAAAYLAAAALVFLAVIVGMALFARPAGVTREDATALAVRLAGTTSGLLLASAAVIAVLDALGRIP